MAPEEREMSDKKNTPSEPTKKGPLIERWRSVLKDVITVMKEAELPLTASSLAYTTILSIIPLIAVSFSIFKMFGGMEKLYGTLEPFIFENLAEGSDEKTLETIRSFVSNIHAGTLGITGFIGLIITSMTMLASVEKSVNRVWKVPESRPLFQRIQTYWMFITLGPLALAVALGGATTLNVSVKQILPSGVVLFPILVCVFFGMYKYIPHRRVYWQPALIASLTTSITWLVAKAAYSFYVKKVVAYDKIYGSLGAIPILLVWIYVAWLVILAGAALSAALQRRVEFP